MLYGAIAASKIRPPLEGTILFSGAGNLTVSTTALLNPVANFGGAGRLTVSAATTNPVLQGSAAYAGAGQMTAAASIIGQISASAAFSGAGGIAANATIQSSQASAFLARTSGLDATHINAYSNLINGLVADGIWSKFDALWVFATQDETTALLNLCSASYAMSKVLSPTFTADQGFNGNATNYLDDGAALNSLSQFSQNSGHIMAWNLTSGGSILAAIGVDGGLDTHIIPRYNDSYAYYRLNNTTGVSAAPSTGKGCFLASRTSSVILKGYKNGSEFASSGSSTAGAVNSNNLTVPDLSAASTDLIAAASVGAGLDATEASNLYSRLYTYLQAVGVSSPT